MTYRLNVVEIAMPPLASRGQDVLLLADHFLTAAAARNQRRVSGFTEAARRALLGHAWPGNVRELSHAIERAVILAHDEWIDARDLPLAGGAPPVDDGCDTLESMERAAMQRLLEEQEWNLSRAARAGLTRQALYRRMEKFKLG